MDSFPLPKILVHSQLLIMLHSQLLKDTGHSLSRGRGAPEMSYKSALLEDMRNFGIMDRKSKDNCSIINTLKLEMLLDIATDRARWRKVVKTDGVCKALNQWYIAEKTKRNKRHIKSGGENFMPKTPFYSEVQTLGSRLTKAIQRGAVVVGRGRRERIVPEILWSQTSVFPVQTSFAAKLLTNLRNQKDA